jgi:hypothetical protein
VVCRMMKVIAATDVPNKPTRDAACKRPPCLERSFRFCSRSRLSTQWSIGSTRARRDARTL